LDQFFQSHAGFSPFDMKVAQTLGAALRLTPDGISESGSKQGAIYNEMVFACAIFFSDRAAGPYSVVLSARRTKHLRFNDLQQPEPIPRDTDYASNLV
jgi:hypothetical protein